MSEENQFFAGKLEEFDGYQAYVPNTLNNKKFIFNDNKTLKLLEGAAIALSALNNTCIQMDFLNIFTNAYVQLEALRSNEIEGTKVELKEVLTADENSKDANLRKIYNLGKTTHEYYNQKGKLNQNITSVKVIEQINKSLFKGVEVKEKYTGKLRTCQNFIGGDDVLSASFVPPPPKYVEPLMEDLNEFWNDKNNYLPNLIKIAIYHLQFETIHPFVDGNGRTGRTLINLQLKKLGLLQLPILCLSDYWRRNKGLYYHALEVARFSNDIEHWVRFFLQSIMQASVERMKSIQAIKKLQEKSIELIEDNFKSSVHHQKLLYYLFSNRPFVTVSEASEVLELSYQRTNKIIQDLVGIGILTEENSFKRNRVFLFKEFEDMIFKKINQD